MSTTTVLTASCYCATNEILKVNDKMTKRWRRLQHRLIDNVTVM